MAALTTEELHKLDKQMMHLKDMVVAESRDLSQVKPALQDIIDGNFAVSPTPNFTPISEYPELIWARSEERGWGFTHQQIEQLRVELTHATGPVGVTIWRGRDLAYNWAESLAWLQNSVEAAGLEYHRYFDDTPSFYPGSELQGSESYLAVAKLDFSRWDLKNGLVPTEVRKQQPRWPSLEVPDWLALNPAYALQMDGEKIPFLMAPGFVVGSGHAPSFHRRGREFDVYCHWAGSEWYHTACVGFRD